MPNPLNAQGRPASLRSDVGTLARLGTSCSVKYCHSSSLTPDQESASFIMPPWNGRFPGVLARICAYVCDAGPSMPSTVTPGLSDVYGSNTYCVMSARYPGYMAMAMSALMGPALSVGSTGAAGSSPGAQPASDPTATAPRPAAAKAFRNVLRCIASPLSGLGVWFLGADPQRCFVGRRSETAVPWNGTLSVLGPSVSGVSAD